MIYRFGKNLLLTLTFALLWLAGCREKYLLPDTGPAKGYLVVEGSINCGAGTTSIRLTRAVALVDTVNVNEERFAQVTIEANDNTQYGLFESSPGIYTTNLPGLDLSKQYRLYIQTADGKQYRSDFEKPLTTPAIDTITWERPGGLEIFINTHDPAGTTKYYRWEYEETWEFHSFGFSTLKFIVDPATYTVISTVDRPYDEAVKMYTCWHTEPSKSILIGSSAALTADSIHLKLKEIPPADWRLSVLYSINFKQSAISSREYDFLRRMKKNTEQVGSLFDAQPSELKGNLHNIDDPRELVVGYVGVSDIREKRRFIKNSEVPDWNYASGCREEKVRNNRDSLNPSSIPLYGTDYVGLFPQYIMVTTPVCGDCTLRGYNTKPVFWP